MPIAATFDLHANEDEEFLKWADISLVIKRYPHYDARLQGGRLRAANARETAILEHTEQQFLGRRTEVGKPVNDQGALARALERTGVYLALFLAAEQLLFDVPVGQRGRRSSIRLATSAGAAGWTNRHARG